MVQPLSVVVATVWTDKCETATECFTEIQMTQWKPDRSAPLIVKPEHLRLQAHNKAAFKRIDYLSVCKIFSLAWLAALQKAIEFLW